MRNLQKLYGNWTEGFALDVHTVSSECIGYDDYGHPIFDTVRSTVGELLFNLKYRNNLKAGTEIASIALPFLHEWLKGKNIEVVIPAPFSKQRTVQPVF